MIGDEHPDPILIETAHPGIEVDAEALRSLLHRVAADEGYRVESLTVVLADHDRVLKLNRRYLKHDYVTDVLSFNLADDPSTTVDGEIYVDLDTARERHAEFGATLENEVFRYAVHGLLHLMGHADASPEERKRMRALEDRYLAGP